MVTKIPSSIIVESISSFLEPVKRYRDEWFPRDEDVVGPWFRGQHNVEWPLLPKVYRLCGMDRWVEDEIREEFVQRGPALCSTVPTNDWDWYFLMQHYGAPTRLLDWTDGALIGLYFAVRESLGLADAAVWMLDPFWLNTGTINRDEIIPPSAPGYCRKTGID